MEELFECAVCGELNQTLIDPDEGDYQEFAHPCSMCDCQHSVAANFNYATGRFELQITHEVLN